MSWTTTIKTSLFERPLVALGKMVVTKEYTKRPWQMPLLPQLGGRRVVCGTCTPPLPQQFVFLFPVNKIRSRHDWSNDPEHWSSCSKCGSIGLLGDDGEVLAWGWMLPLIKSECVMIC